MSAKLIIVAALIREFIQQYIEERTTPVPNEALGSPCWLWMEGSDGRYGHAYFAGGRIKAHIFAFLGAGGILRRHEVVDHLCNRTLCCQPLHLRAATQSQNMARCFQEGRGRSPFIRGRDERQGPAIAQESACVD